MPRNHHRKPSVSGGSQPKLDGIPKRRHAARYILITLLIFLLSFFFLTSSSSRRSKEIVTDLRLFHHTPTHKPPDQKNSTSGDVHWFSDWKWLNPFSASITFDDDRSVLPPLRPRPHIYTFFDAEAEKEDDKVRAAQNKLLLIWRRAWWAQGFTPVVLGRAEAMNNPLYQMVQTKNLPLVLEGDILRWLAWGQMGTGILANWLLLPMAAYDDDFLSSMRRGEYPKLTRYEGLGSGLLLGEKDSINAAIKEALESPNLKDPRALYDAVQSGTIALETKPASVAFYDATANAEYYKDISDKLSENKADGFSTLAKLITSHLHLTFLNAFPKGFAVLTPYPAKARIVTKTAHALADTLRQCPSDSPLSSSCPPNNRSCTPCGSLSPLPVKTPEHYANGSTAKSTFVLGTVPNPYAFASLLSKTQDLTTRHIRRDTGRDRWLTAVTQKALGSEIGGPSRLVSFKETVAGERGYAGGLWLVDETPPSKKDLEYHFGFELAGLNLTTAEIPTKASKAAANGKTVSIPAFFTAEDTTSESKEEDKPKGTEKAKDKTGDKKSQQQQEKKKLEKRPLSPKEKEKSFLHQSSLLSAAQDVIRQAPRDKKTPTIGRNVKKNKKKNKKGGKLGENVSTMEMVEAWNLADSEAWRFVRALRARERVEREKWEADERRFAGAEGESSEGRWRWFDRG